MAQCSFTNISKFRHLGQQIVECPISEAETLREKILKNVLKKQLNVNLNVNDCLSNKDKFVSSSMQKNVSVLTEGLKSLESFMEIANDFNLREILSSCNFDSREIEYLISGQDCFKGDRVSRSQKLEAMESKLQLRLNDLDNESTDNFSGAISLNRHEFEEECKYLAGDMAEKLTPLLIKMKPKTDSTLHRDHPMNKIHELALELFPVESSEDNDTNSQVDECSTCHNPTKKRNIGHLDSKSDTFWDLKEIPVMKKRPEIVALVSGCENRKSSVHPIRVVKTEPSKIKTDFTKAFVWSLSPSQFISLDDIENNRASIEMIRGNSKFCNYSPGQPSRTLFLKNLPRKLDPLIIVRLFCRFETITKVQYRILGGRMKGQAFVTFSDLETSALALKTCNGYFLEGKPIVMEFSKK